jgi:hypothetical protein
MIPQEIAEQLQRIASMNDFATHSAELTDAWSRAGDGVEMIEPVLRFIEQHPTIDFGMPGPLVHFAEKFCGKGFEEKLMESVERKPMLLTVWMLNRVLNGTSAGPAKRRLHEVMERVRDNQAADQNTLKLVNRFLQRLAQ